MDKNEALFKYSLRLGDNGLILGHRLSELCSHGPILEEDLAITNIALDALGQASSFLKYACEVEGKDRSADDLAYRRPEREFLNVQLAEQPNGDFGYTIVRQLFLDQYHALFYEALTKSTDETYAGIAAKALKEEVYHLRHSSEWVIRLGLGTEESKIRVQNAINDLWMYVGELFEMNEVDQTLIAEGIAPDLNEIKAVWYEKIGALLKSAELEQPEDGYMATGGRNGIHTEHLGFLLADMQYLQRAYPDAEW